MGRAQPVRFNDEQRRVVNAAAGSLTEEQRGRFHKRMQNIRRDRERSGSHGEGPSTFTKGKTVDARNWGAVGIDAQELDPEAQRCALENYAAQRALQENDNDIDPEEQRAALEYWRAMKAAKRPQATVETATDASEHAYEELGPRPDARERELEWKLRSLQQQLDDFREERTREAHDRSRRIPFFGNYNDNVFTTDHNNHEHAPSASAAAKSKKAANKRKRDARRPFIEFQQLEQLGLWTVQAFEFIELV
ncbi:hypothetical protein L227DRAFT_651120 [Lentinus tigrinus ALCF2SS1-6]|uniref:Uncharacterized protein n=1 Tax=Lentinus tigrinus ALCF2SS1-6 TaxID=1328759 RepID=A0A5C2SIS5_9APHY|nr:hypothetical protein L227DRAFT_651120 [Lentinus tigrinus ALCF2SS1-6]